jgi:HEAT repeat protein
MLSPKFSRAGYFLICLAVTVSFAHAAEPDPSPELGCYISTGDNHWLGESLPIDSKASIEDSFALLARLGVRTVYWRGLEEATWMDTMISREENCRYDSAFHWFHQLYRDVHPDQLAVEAAHRHGMEIWGVGTLVDWQGPGDTPGFADFPSGYESRLRLEHPEWVPVDRSGLLKQAGPIEFAYPEARKALVDLHMKFVRQDGYDGVMFVTYAENYGMRFQDEFGFNEPIVKEFQRRTKVNLLTDPFTRAASRFDWYALRGEYLTKYFRELKEQLQHDGKKLGLIVNPFEPHFTQPWNVPELMLTAGHIYVDLDTYVREGIMDRLMVYGYCSPQIQNRAVEDCLWLTRDTPCKVGALTSSPFADRWKPFQKKGASIAMSLGEDASYLDRSNIPEQPISALTSDDPVLRMRVLAQIIYGKATANTDQVAPLIHDHNVIVRRLALEALGKLKDPAAVPIIEEGLADEENSVRCAAALALRDNNRPESAAKMLEAVDRHGTHPLCEMVFHTMPRLQPLPRAILAEAASHHPNPLVRSTAMRSLALMPDASVLPTFTAGLQDSDRFVRFASAEGLGRLSHSSQAAETLIAALKHEDPTVSDRAATSLGMIVATKSPEGAALRSQILAGLAELYGKLGDGCTRSDAEWGYRPVGNALLKLGPEGEQILQGFMDQQHDRQLALEAWKTLWIRQDAKTFSEVTEKENDEAFQHLPAWLRTPAKE